MEMVGRRSVMTMAGKDFVQVSPHLLVLCVPLLGRRVTMMPSEYAVFLDECDVRLRQRPVERAVLPSDDVVGHKPPCLHVGEDVHAFRSILEEFEEGHL